MFKFEPYTEWPARFRSITKITSINNFSRLEKYFVPETPLCETT